MESLLSFFRMHWEQEPKMRNLFISKGGILRFMESPLSLFRMHWDHELPGGCSAGVLACECTGRLARCSCGRRDAAATRSRDGCATRFMESPHDFLAAYWDHEPTRPRAPPRLRSRATQSMTRTRTTTRTKGRFMEGPDARLSVWRQEQFAL